MKQRPILFNSDNIRAILAGHKTQTRRVMKPQPRYVPESKAPGGSLIWTNSQSKLDRLLSLDRETEFIPALCKTRPHVMWAADYSPFSLAALCPYGKIGDELWVRETQWISGGYVATDPENFSNEGKTPSIFMRRADSRITLRITDVRVERVQEISAIDAMWEGIKRAHIPVNRKTIEALGNRSSTGLAVIDDFAYLWDTINKARGFGWDENVWVWVVKFEIQKGGDLHAHNS